MPLYVFKCPVCGTEKEVLAKYTDPAPTCFVACGTVGTLMERQFSPSAFRIGGFNAENGYASPRTFVQRHPGGITTVVTGNPEAFSESISATKVREAREEHA